MQGSPDTEIGMDELKELDPLLAKNLETLLDFDGDVQEVFQRTFEIEVESMNQRVSVDLKPNGSEIPLTNDNRQGIVIW